MLCFTISDFGGRRRIWHTLCHDIPPWHMATTPGHGTRPRHRRPRHPTHGTHKGCRYILECPTAQPPHCADGTFVTALILGCGSEGWFWECHKWNVFCGEKG